MGLGESSFELDAMPKSPCDTPRRSVSIGPRETNVWAVAFVMDRLVSVVAIAAQTARHPLAFGPPINRFGTAVDRSAFSARAIKQRGTHREVVARLPQQLPALRYQGDPLRHRLPATQHAVDQDCHTSQTYATPPSCQQSLRLAKLVRMHQCAQARWVEYSEGHHLRHRHTSIVYLRIHPLLQRRLLLRRRLLLLLALPLRLEMQARLPGQVLPVWRGRRSLLLLLLLWLLALRCACRRLRRLTGCARSLSARQNGCEQILQAVTEAACWVRHGSQPN